MRKPHFAKRVTTAAAMVRTADPALLMSPEPAAPILLLDFAMQGQTPASWL
jgi:hypothetical protein